MPVPDQSGNLMVCPGTGTQIHPAVKEAIKKEPLMFLGRARQLGWHPGDQAHDNMVHEYLYLRSLMVQVEYLKLQVTSFEQEITTRSAVYAQRCNVLVCESMESKKSPPVEVPPTAPTVPKDVEEKNEK